MRLVPAPLAAVAAVLFALPSPAAVSARSSATTFLAVAPAPNRALTLRDRPNGAVTARLTHAVFGSAVVAGVVRRSGRWAAVTSQVLPNGRVGWVELTHDVVLSRVDVALRVDLSSRRLDVYRGGRLERRIRVAVGAPGSPTPTGRFAVAEKLPGSRFGPAFGCCILALTAHQPNPPAGWDRSVSWFVAFHGGGSIGSAATAGCFHVAAGELRYLMGAVPVGAPVFVSA
jgi:lipoprotein-anchoring transpeptidase ErfK/SrfK